MAANRRMDVGSGHARRRVDGTLRERVPSAAWGCVILRFAAVDELVVPAALGAVLGPVRSVSREILSLPSGFSGASHERLHIELEDGTRETLVLKRARPDANWIARRTGD